MNKKKSLCQIVNFSPISMGTRRDEGEAANNCIVEILAKAAGRYEELQSLFRLSIGLLNVNVSSCEEEKQNSAPDLKNLIN